jgi:hypothetical protein
VFISIVHSIFQDLGVRVDVNRNPSNGLKFHVELVSFGCKKRITFMSTIQHVSIIQNSTDGLHN